MPSKPLHFLLPEDDSQFARLWAEDADLRIEPQGDAEPHIAGIEVTYLEIEEIDLVRLGWW
ncbi:MAG: hypothetical protein V4864_18735 [Pseudomonadota bacterium]